MPVSKTDISPDRTDQLLMQQFAGGNPQAMEVLYTRYFGRLVIFLKHAFGYTHAEDLVQDLFVQMMKNPDAYRPEFSFKTWIYTLASNRCKNALRNEKNRERLVYDFFGTGALTEFVLPGNPDNRIIQKELNRAFELLNEKERCMFYLRYEHGFKNTEIAWVMEVPEGTVRSTLFYILKKLNDELKTLKSEYGKR
ncbi:MAG: RNA polymerase sigma factor [Bacteroidetes bacterium]|nr:RNA polymerase sigma factor [Bacteroidota bacterium]